MAIIVMVSTMSMTVNKHYCSNILVDTALFQEAKTCGMDDDSSHQSDDNHEQDEKDSCCSSENELIKGQDELQLQKVDFNFEQVVFVAAYVHTTLNYSPLKIQKSLSLLNIINHHNIPMTSGLTRSILI